MQCMQFFIGGDSGVGESDRLCSLVKTATHIIKLQVAVWQDNLDRGRLGRSRMPYRTLISLLIIGIVDSCPANPEASHRGVILEWPS